MSPMGRLRAVFFGGFRDVGESESRFLYVHVKFHCTDAMVTMSWHVGCSVENWQFLNFFDVLQRPIGCPLPWSKYRVQDPVVD